MREGIGDEDLFTLHPSSCSCAKKLGEISEHSSQGNAKVHLHHMGGCNPEAHLHPQQHGTPGLFLNYHLQFKQPIFTLHRHQLPWQLSGFKDSQTEAKMK